MRKDEKFYDLTNDTVFKLVFGNPANKRILVCLINALLKYEGKDKICEITILNPADDAEFMGDKTTYLDLKAKDRSNRHYNIEMQVDVPKSWPKRALYYASKLYTSQLEEGEKFPKLRKTLSISLLKGNLFQETKKLHNIYRFRNDDDGSLLGDELIDLHFLELSKFDKEKPRALSTRFEKWLHIFRFGEMYKDGAILLNESLCSEEGIKEAVQAMCNANKDKRARMLIEGHEKWKLMHESDIEEARIEVKLSIAKKLKANGVDLETIQKVTDLSKEEIEEL